MTKQKLERMNSTEHYRMYKSGKQWLFSSILAFGIGLGLLEGGMTARADKTPTVSDQSTPSAATPSGKPNDSGNSVVLKPSQAAPTSATPASTAPSSTAQADQATSAASDHTSAQSAAKPAADSTATSDQSAAKATSTDSAAPKSTDDQKSATSAASLSTPKSAAQAEVTAPTTVQTPKANAASTTPASANTPAQSQAVTQNASVDVDKLKTKLPAGSEVNYNVQTGALTVELPNTATQKTLDDAKLALAATGAKTVSLIAKKDVASEPDTKEGGREAAQYDLLTLPTIQGNGKLVAVVSIANVMAVDQYGDLTYQTNISPFSLLSFLDPVNYSKNGKYLQSFNQDTIDGLKNSDTLIKTIKAQSALGDPSSVIYSRLADHDSDEFLTGYQSFLVDMYQGYLDAYNKYTQLLDEETKENTTSFYYGVQGKADGWAKLKADMNVPTAELTTGYNYAYNDFFNWLTANSDEETNPNDINTNRPLEAGLHSLGNERGLTSGSWVGVGNNRQVIPTADNFWNNYYKPAVFVVGGLNGSPFWINGSSWDFTDAAGEPVTYPDIFLTLGHKISDAVLDSFKKVYAQGVKQAALDALQGKQMVLDVAAKPVNISLSSGKPNANDFTLLSGYFTGQIAQNADLQSAFVDGYRFAKFYLTKNTATLSTTPQNSFDYDVVDGYLVPKGIASKVTAASSRENPIDKAIISVLSGIKASYNVIKGSATVTNFEADADDDKKGVYSAGHYMNTVYDLAQQVAYNARAEWTTAVEHSINGIKGGNTVTIDQTSKWFQMSPYVYSTVFNALNKSFSTNDAAKSWIIKALNKADQDIIVSAAANNGVPKVTNAPITVDIGNSVLKINLNASTYYYDDADPTFKNFDLGSLGVNQSDGTSNIGTISNQKADIKFGMDDTNIGAKVTIQNVVNYAYYHEQAVAAAAFEAGYHAADKNLNTKTGLSDKAPVGENAKYQFQYRTEFIGSLYPANNDFVDKGSTADVVLKDTSANSDGTTTELSVTNDYKGQFVSVSADVKDKDGKIISGTPSAVYTDSK